VQHGLFSQEKLGFAPVMGCSSSVPYSLFKFYAPEAKVPQGKGWLRVLQACSCSFKLHLLNV